MNAVDGRAGAAEAVPAAAAPHKLITGVHKTAIICGPPILIKFTLSALQELGFDKTQVYTTMELKMKCLP